MHNAFDGDIGECASALFVFNLLMNLIVWGLATIEGGLSGGWYVAAWISFAVAFVIWMINPIWQHYVGSVAFIASFCVPTYGAWATWDTKEQAAALVGHMMYWI